MTRTAAAPASPAQLGTRARRAMAGPGRVHRNRPRLGQGRRLRRHRPAAAAALRKCEDKLRDLHPYAMARYDRLRARRLAPLDAMREAAPLFARAPDARVGDPPPARFSCASIPHLSR